MRCLWRPCAACVPSMRRLCASVRRLCAVYAPSVCVHGGTDAHADVHAARAMLLTDFGRGRGRSVSWGRPGVVKWAGGRLGVGCGRRGSAGWGFASGLSTPPGHGLSKYRSHSQPFSLLCRPCAACVPSMRRLCAPVCVPSMRVSMGGTNAADERLACAMLLTDFGGGRDRAFFGGDFPRVSSRTPLGRPWWGRW